MADNGFVSQLRSKRLDGFASACGERYGSGRDITKTIVGKISGLQPHWPKQEGR
jgi:hypothetical protein